MATSPPSDVAIPRNTDVTAPFSFPGGNFTVKSLSGDEFRVSRCALEGSEVFRDMFALCDESDVELVIPEPSQVLSVLLRLLHEPLARQPAQTGGAIPLPLLPALFRLVDKYALKAELADTLATHLAAHAPVQPLSVYSLATQLELEKVASDATAHLLKKPLHKYTSDEVALIPSVKAYHALVALHAHRVEKLKELVLAEELFPKDYGLCGTHGDATRDVWARKANYVWGQIEPGTDVAEEMSPVLTADVIRDCKLCHMGCIRSIEMIRYKSARVANTTARLRQHLKNEESDDD